MSTLLDLLGKPDDDGEKKPSSLWNLLGSGGSIEDASRTRTEREVPCAVEFNDQQMFWAMRNLPISEATKHFLMCGATGSGKSVNIQLFLQSIANRFKAGNPRAEQLIIFDAKYDVIPMLSALGLKLSDPDNPTESDHPNIWLINPYDRRSAEWNLSEITNTPTMARHVATLLIPEDRYSSGGSKYFTDAGRELVLATIIALGHIAGDDWTLRDLLCALSSRESIRLVTEQHKKRAAQLAARILDDEQHSPGVLSGIGSRLGQYEQIAALWHSQKKRRVFSITEFLTKPGVLILGNDPVLRDSLWPINAILLKSLTSEILRGSETFMPRHWFLLDEFRAMERLDCMPDLLNRGRSMGASVMIGLQGIEGLADNKVYGWAQTQEMLGQCGYKTFLRVGGPETADWAQRLFGQTRYTEARHSESWGKSGYSHSTNYDVIDRMAFLASTFMNLPFPVPDGVFESINDVPCFRSTIRVKAPFNTLLNWRKPKDPNIKALEPRSSIVEQTLESWKPKEQLFFFGKRKPKDEEKTGGKKGRKRKPKKLPQRDE